MSEVVTGEPELIFEMSGVESGGRNLFLTEPLWPALFYFDEDLEPMAVLFEDFELPYAFPVTINDTVSASNDPDFPLFVELIRAVINCMMMEAVM